MASGFAVRLAKPKLSHFLYFSFTDDLTTVYAARVSQPERRGRSNKKGLK
jgi:hypothetical protein